MGCDGGREFNEGLWPSPSKGQQGKLYLIISEKTFGGNSLMVACLTISFKLTLGSPIGKYLGRYIFYWVQVYITYFSFIIRALYYTCLAAISFQYLWEIDSLWVSLLWGKMQIFLVSILNISQSYTTNRKHLKILH